MELLDQIKEMVKRNELRFEGNHQTTSRYLLEDGDADYLLNKVERELIWHKYGITDNPLLTMEECSNCGAHLSYRLEGNTFVPTEEVACFQSDYVDVEIHIPTGEVMAADWLKHGKEVIKHLEQAKVSINNLKGTATRIQEYGRGNIGHIYVGNTSPGLFQQQDTLFIGRERYDEEDELIPLVEGVDSIGYVCTDLWWVTLCDRAIYEQHAIAQHGEEEGKRLTQEAWDEADVTFTLTPGTYRLRYFVEVDDDTSLYAKMTKIEE